MVDVFFGNFAWNADKESENIRKHGVDFVTATRAFSDPLRIIADDLDHSIEERLFYCLGRIGSEILTVRFMYRGSSTRIYGAGYWRKGRKIYEEKNQIH